MNITSRSTFYQTRKKASDSESIFAKICTKFYYRNKLDFIEATNEKQAKLTTAKSGDHTIKQLITAKSGNHTIKYLTTAKCGDYTIK